jgi:hypothetical protein
MLYYLIKDLSDLLKIQKGNFNAKMSSDLIPAETSSQMLELFQD